MQHVVELYKVYIDSHSIPIFLTALLLQPLYFPCLSIIKLILYEISYM